MTSSAQAIHAQALLKQSELEPELESELDNVGGNSANAPLPLTAERLVQDVAEYAAWLDETLELTRRMATDMGRRYYEARLARLR